MALYGTVPPFWDPEIPIDLFFFSKMEVTQNGWLSMQHSVNIGDFGAPLFQETSICTVD